MTFVRDLGFCLLLASIGACFQKDEQCSCFPSSFAVNAPSGAVRDVKLSGAACADTRPTGPTGVSANARPSDPETLRATGFGFRCARTP